jgi:hypothetical protein
MQKVGEQAAAERKIAQVRQVRSAARIGARIFQILLGRVRLQLAQKRHQRAVPGLIDHRLMSQH